MEAGACLSDSESPGQFTGVVGPGVRRPKWNRQQGRQTKRAAAAAGALWRLGKRIEAGELGGKMPDAALGFINHSAPFFFAFSLSRSACGRVRRYPTSRLRHQVQPKFCPGSIRAGRQQGQLKCCIEKGGGGVKFLFLVVLPASPPAALCNGACMIGLGSPAAEKGGRVN